MLDKIEKLTHFCGLYFAACFIFWYIDFDGFFMRMKMIKRIFATVLCLLSSSIFALACSKAVPTDNPNFCASFKTAATCYCTSSGLPAGMCQDMDALYNRMIGVFGTLEKACLFQKYTSPQDCMNNWNCYRFGGKDSTGKLCSSTTKPCK